MKKRFYAWLWSKFYLRALSIANGFYISGKMAKHHDAIKLQNALVSLKDELITGEVK